MSCCSRTNFFAFTLLLASLATLVVSGCGSSDTTPPAASIGDNAATSSREATPDNRLSVSTDRTDEDDMRGSLGKRSRAENYPEVLIKTSLGDIRLRLDANKAPATVHNFLASYVERGYYDGLIFHYVQPGSMILTGLFDESLEARPTRSEIQNEASNGLSNKRGTIAMSRDPNYIHSSTSQFFINCADNPAFDHVDRDDSADYGYCVFGEVIEGMDVVDAIAAVPVTDKDQFVNLPAEAVIIHSATRVK